MEQLPLDLRDDAQQQPPGMWRYDYSAKSLTEQVGGLQYVYGSWEHLFGCWEKPVIGSQAQEIIPDWDIMDENGVWQDSIVAFRARFPNVNLQRSLKWRRHERAAFAAYLSSIPRPIRSLVAPYGPYTWLLLDMIWQVPAFARFLDQEIRTNNAQFVMAVLALANAFKLSRNPRRELTIKLMTDKRKELLSDLGSTNNPGPFLKALDRVSAHWCSADFYRDLLQMFDDPKRAKILSHERNIDVNMVLRLKNVPEELLFYPFISLAQSRRCGTGCLLTILHYFVALPQREKLRVRNAFKHATNEDDILRLGERWAARVYEYVKYPKPPLAPHPALTPLSTPKMMSYEARTMRNCLVDMIDSVVDGEGYFYHWDGPEPVTFEIVPERKPWGQLWSLLDAKGFNNKEISVSHKFELKDLIRRQSPVDTHPSNSSFTRNNDLPLLNPVRPILVDA